MSRASTSYISLKSAGRPLRVLLGGAGGYLGRCLEHHLRSRNFEVLPLSRNRSGPVDEFTQIEWTDVVDHGLPRGIDFVINVAGARVLTKGHFSDAAKAEIEASRVYTNGILAQAIRQSDSKPRAFITASCASYYPPSRTTVYDERYVSINPSEFKHYRYLHLRKSNLLNLFSFVLTFLTVFRYRHPDLDQFGALSLPYFSRLAEAAENASIILGAGEKAAPVIPKNLYKVGRNARGETIYKAEKQRMELAARAAKGDVEAERELQRITTEAMADRDAFERGGLNSLDLAGLPLGQNTYVIPEVARSMSDIDWETTPRTDADVRVVNLRLGAVIGRSAPVVEEAASHAVLAGLGSGEQYTPWVHVDDAMGLFVHGLTCSDVRGALNGVAPVPATNTEIMSGIAHVLDKPFLPFNVPRKSVVKRYGALRAELMTESTKVYPAKALATGYEFQHSTLRSALTHIDGEYERAWLRQDNSYTSFASQTSNKPL